MSLREEVKIKSGAYGLPTEVCVRVDPARGTPRLDLVSPDEQSGQETRVRVSAALAALERPLQRPVVASVGPLADRRGRWTESTDLAVAVATAIVAGEAPAFVDLGTTALIGELSLGGELRGTRGVLPILRAMRAQGVARAVVPAANEPEAALVDGLDVFIAEDLAQVLAWIAGEWPLRRAILQPRPRKGAPYDYDEVRGLGRVRRALEVAAAGHHALLLVGRPGSGKTMLARRLPGILPDLDRQEILEVNSTWSRGGWFASGSLPLSERPFRAPHHTVSRLGLMGSTVHERHVGELGLARGGVLLLDEIEEFQAQHVTEVLADSASGHPALVIGGAKPCLCGHPRACTCPLLTRERYRRRLEDLASAFGMVAEVDPETDTEPGDPSADMRARVMRARVTQRVRYREGHASMPVNGLLPDDQIGRHLGATEEARRLLDASVPDRRRHAEVARLARTIADLRGSVAVEREDVVEGISYSGLP